MIFTLSQAAEQIGVHPDTLREWANTGVVKASKTRGGHRRFSENQIAAIKRQKPQGKLCACGKGQRLVGQTECSDCREKRLCSCGQYYKAKGRDVCGECRKRPWRQERRVKDRTNDVLKMAW